MKISMANDPHSGHLMAEDENITKAVNSLWGISSDEKERATVSDSPVEAGTKKKMTDVPAPAKKEKTVSRSERNYNTKTDKNNKEYLQKIWGEFVSLVKTSPFYEYLQYASPYKIQEGIFQISVPTKFAEDALKEFKQEIHSVLMRLDSSITGIRISATFNVNYYVRIHDKIISDKVINNSAFRIYCALLTYRNNATNQCSVGVRRFVSDFGFSSSTVVEALKILEAEGYIKRINLKNFNFPLIEESERKIK